MTQVSKPPRRRPARGRRLLFGAVLLLLVAACIELGGAVTFWAMTGEAFTWGRATAMRAEVTGEAVSEQVAMRAVANAGVAVHPFLGFVGNADLEEVGGVPISSYGFLDTDVPIHARSEDEFVVAVVGGSVALQLGVYADATLARELQKSPAVRGKTVRVVRMAVGGWKQPQQLFALQLAWLRGGHFDLVLNLDGFNEVAMPVENVGKGVPGWFPRSWAGLMERQPDRQQLLRLGKLQVAREQRTAAARSADSAWWSPTLQCLWLAGDRRKSAAIVALQQEVEGAERELTFASTGPGTEGRDLMASRREMVAIWQRASRELFALCREHGAIYHHFLQPNQYVEGSKPMGAEERKVAIFAGELAMRDSVVHGYPMLRTAGAELRREGVPFTDLTPVFADHPEPLYVDTCCHVGRRGSEILATRMAAEVRARLDLAGFVASELVVEPEQLRLVEPGRPAALRVLAIDASGRQIDVSSTGLGTTFVVEPASLARVASDGTVVALRRGQGRIRVAFGAQQAELSLSADWPDDLVLTDGVLRDVGGDGPQLRVVRADADAGAVAQEPPQLTCTGLPDGGLRLLAAANKALPAAVRPGQEAFGIAPVLLSGEGRSLVMACPVKPLAGLPLFLRVYVVDGKGLIRAASNTLILTRN